MCYAPSQLKKTTTNSQCILKPEFVLFYYLHVSISSGWKCFSHVNTFSTCLLKSRSTSLAFEISPSQCSLHFLWSSSSAFGNFHIAHPLVLLLVPQPSMKQLSPDMMIPAHKIKFNSQNQNFLFELWRHFDITVVHRRDHVTKLKPKQRDHPLKFAGFYNQSPLLTILKCDSFVQDW